MWKLELIRTAIQAHSQAPPIYKISNIAIKGSFFDPKGPLFYFDSKYINISLFGTKKSKKTRNGPW